VSIARGKGSVANSSERAGTEAWSLPPQDRLDKSVGLVTASLLVVVASMPTLNKTGLLGTTGALLGVFGCLLGTRWLGGTTIIVSSARS
jgi:hypothetical protein